MQERGRLGNAIGFSTCTGAWVIGRTWSILILLAANGGDSWGSGALPGTPFSPLLGVNETFYSGSSVISSSSVTSLSVSSSFDSSSALFISLFSLESGRRQLSAVTKMDVIIKLSYSYWKGLRPCMFKDVLAWCASSENWNINRISRILCTCTPTSLSWRAWVLVTYLVVVNLLVLFKIRAWDKGLIAVLALVWTITSVQSLMPY